MIGSDSSRTVGEMACAMVLRPADNDEDILLIIRLALFDFLSAFSSLVDDVEPAVGGGEREFPGSRLDVEIRLLIDIGRWWAGEAYRALSPPPACGRGPGGGRPVCHVRNAFGEREPTP